MHICTHLYTLQPKKIPNCNRVRTETLWFQNVRFGSKTYDLAPKQTFLAPKKQQQRRHTRARFCRLGPLDRTRLRCRTTVPQLVSRPDQRPPSGRASFALAPNPPEHGHRFMYRAVPECTWVWILTRQGTGSRGTTAPAAPRRWVHRSRRGPPSKPVRLQREFCAHQPGHPPAGVRAGYRHSSRTVRWQTASCQDRTTLPVVGGVGRGNTPSLRRQLQCGCCGGHRLRTKHLSQYHAPAGTAGRLTQRRWAACGQDSQQSKSPRCTPLSQT